VSRHLQLEEVIQCGQSGYSMRETAEELGMSYFTVCRFAKKHKIEHLFRHGNAKAQTSQKSQGSPIATPNNEA
jgi:transposase